MALAITADGTKVPVGLWMGDTENKAVVTALPPIWSTGACFAEGGLLVVIDGAKALASAVRKVFGDAVLVQRCTLHKCRNVRDHLPKDAQPWVDRKLAAAFAHQDPAAGERAARDLASQLEDRWPDAAASLREGLAEMFTVRRLGVTGRLAASLTNTNCVESMISIARDTTRNVKRWRDGKMIKRHADFNDDVAGFQPAHCVVRGAAKNRSPLGVKRLIRTQVRDRCVCHCRGKPRG